MAFDVDFVNLVLANSKIEQHGGYLGGGRMKILRLDRFRDTFQLLPTALTHGNPGPDIGALQRRPSAAGAESLEKLIPKCISGEQISPVCGGSNKFRTKSLRQIVICEAPTGLRTVDLDAPLDL